MAIAAAIARPEAIRSLVLVRPAWLDGPALPHLALVARIGSWIEAVGRHRATDLLEADPFYLHLAMAEVAMAASVRDLLRGGDEAPDPVALSVMVTDRPFASPGELARLDVPTVVVANDDDYLHPADMAETLAAALPRASFLVAPPRYRRPEAHAAAVRQATAELHASLAAPGKGR